MKSIKIRTEVERLNEQIKFIAEIEKLKSITRQNITLDNQRPENSAEHSWHVALMAVILSEYANSTIDTFKVLKMLLIHDLVEIDFGDTWLYDEKANSDKVKNETLCAQRLFALLPNDQEQEFIQLWTEFEDCKTAEAKFARAIDSLQPIINHRETGGALVKAQGLTANQVYEKKKNMSDGSDELWKKAQEIIEDCKRLGIFQ